MLPLTLRRRTGRRILGGLGDNGVAVVVEPIDQRADRGILLILDHGGIIERTQQVSARLELTQQPLVVDVETEGLGGGVEVCAVDKQRDLLVGYGHRALSLTNTMRPAERVAHDPPPIIVCSEMTTAATCEIVPSAPGRFSQSRQAQ
jgi:hypothetical protein